MDNNSPAEPLSRREFLRMAALGAAGAALMTTTFMTTTILTPQFAEGQVRPPDRDGPWRLGIQSYSLRGMKIDEALDKTREMGLRYWEGWDGHMPITDDPAVLAEYKKKLSDRGIAMLAYGVVGMSGNEVDIRKKFEFAKAMGVPTLSASPTPDAFPILDRLCNEYKINVAIHNHGPGDDMYDKWEKVLAAIQGHNHRIGACIDTGHLLRSDERPEVAAEKIGNRVYDIHLKDVKSLPGNQKEFTEIGKGLLDVVILLKVLRRSGYEKRGMLAIEYEDHEDNPVPYIQECVTYMRNVIPTVNNITLAPK